MGVLGSFISGLVGGSTSKYRKPTSAESKDINAIISRIDTCGKHLETVDSVDKYFTEWDKYSTEMKILQSYEQQGIKFIEPPSSIHNQLLAEVPRLEKNVVNRAYDRMQRDVAKLTTEKGKQKKADAFFCELEFYYPRLQPETVELIKVLKNQTIYVKSTNTEDKAEEANKYCTKCGVLLEPGALFCGKCGNKV